MSKGLWALCARFRGRKTESLLTCAVACLVHWSAPQAAAQQPPTGPVIFNGAYPESSSGVGVHDEFGRALSGRNRQIPSVQQFLGSMPQSTSMGWHNPTTGQSQIGNGLGIGSGFNTPPPVYVHGYNRTDGTPVQSHYRTHPDTSRTNNWSSWGNVNPYTGQRGYRR